MSLLPTRIIDINSDDRTSGTSSNFTIRLPNLDSRYDRVSLIAASIPKTYYNVQDGLNTFILTEGIQQVTLTVTPGNYSFNSFAAAIQTLLISNSFNSITYTVTPNLLLGKLQILSNSTQQTTISFPPSSDLYKNFGMNYLTEKIFNSSNSFISDNVCIFTINVVMINSSIVKGVSSINTAANLLSMIGVNSSLPFSSISYENYSPLYNSRECQISTSATFIITDIDGVELGLNGIPCNLTLMFFKFDNTNLILRKQIYLDHADRLINQA